ncbi:hypothetical protein CkaCkLH20_09311 [Colletotrichum karsti]|uniref:Cyclochlorotine biosynthesis protein O n=1 Tax=Colletotrichum karsti TaxID=1095194 RepID=A0A9P6LH43_9PEZI|nr:uncharacterized protein CkaCkLH20_09311 [Colletotrichum karsti]KAF9873148.1 hypothetical protein CkaCkLH20_09311 [Colletotrichum karsti]
MMLSNMFLPTHKYVPLNKRCTCGSEDDDAESLQIYSKGHYKTTKAILKICIATHVMMIAVGAVLWVAWHRQPLNQRLKDVSFYSPLLDRIEIPLTVRFDEPQVISGGSGDMTWGSYPNTEIDEMWEGLASEATIPVTEAEIIALRKDPSVAVMLPEEYHLGNEKTYLAHALIFHRLHCLDYIRKAVYKEYYYKNGTESVPMHAEHIAHCLAMILDHLTCAGDPGVYVYQWYEHTEIPLPDANTWGKCWDFESFRQKFDNIALKKVNPFSMSKPLGAKTVKEHNNLQEIIYRTRNSPSKHNI